MQQKLELPGATEREPEITSPEEVKMEQITKVIIVKIFWLLSSGKIEWAEVWDTMGDLYFEQLEINRVSDNEDRDKKWLEYIVTAINYVAYIKGQHKFTTLTSSAVVLTLLSGLGPKTFSSITPEIPNLISIAEGRVPMSVVDDFISRWTKKQGESTNDGRRLKKAIQAVADVIGSSDSLLTNMIPPEDVGGIKIADKKTILDFDPANLQWNDGTKEEWEGFLALMRRLDMLDPEGIMGGMDVAGVPAVPTLEARFVPLSIFSDDEVDPNKSPVLYHPEFGKPVPAFSSELEIPNDFLVGKLGEYSVDQTSLLNIWSKKAEANRGQPFISPLDRDVYLSNIVDRLVKVLSQFQVENQDGLHVFKNMIFRGDEISNVKDLNLKLIDPDLQEAIQYADNPGIELAKVDKDRTYSEVVIDVAKRLFQILLMQNSDLKAELERIHPLKPGLDTMFWEVYFLRYVLKEKSELLLDRKRIHSRNFLNFLEQGGYSEIDKAVIFMIRIIDELLGTDGQKYLENKRQRFDYLTLFDLPLSEKELLKLSSNDRGVVYMGLRELIALYCTGGKSFVGKEVCFNLTGVELLEIDKLELSMAREVDIFLERWVDVVRKSKTEDKLDYVLNMMREFAKKYIFMLRREIVD